MSKGPGPGGSAASSAPPAATAQVLQAQPEKPQHYVDRTVELRMNCLSSRVPHMWFPLRPPGSSLGLLAL